MTDQTQDQTENTEAVTTPAKEKKAKEVKIVTMEDGSQVNFGVRANLITSLDLDTSTISFKISTGKIINWLVEHMENLTTFQKTVYMYGLLEKVKTSLAPVKVDALEVAINKQIESINKGEFNVRALTQAGEVVLTDLQKAYAIAVSYLDPSKAHWANVDNGEVIAEVLTLWESKSAIERNKIRRHPNVAVELAKIQMDNGFTSDVELI